MSHMDASLIPVAFLEKTVAGAIGKQIFFFRLQASNRFLNEKNYKKLANGIIQFFKVAFGQTTTQFENRTVELKIYIKKAIHLLPSGIFQCQCGQNAGNILIIQ